MKQKRTNPQSTKKLYPTVAYLLLAVTVVLAALALLPELNIRADLNDNIFHFVRPYYVAHKRRVPSGLTALPDDATNYRRMALAFEEMGNYKEARKRWFKLVNTLPGPATEGGAAEAKLQWWEALYRAIRCDLLARDRDACRRHLLFFPDVWSACGPVWRRKFRRLIGAMKRFLQTE